MKKVCTEVVDDYSKYENLLLGDKLTTGGPIYVSVLKPSSPRWKVNRLSIEHVDAPNDDIELYTEVSCHEEGKFKFLLFAKDFMGTPLVNFDSQGGAHRNNFDDVPFPHQQITTPHFNRYNERGHRYAYKNDALRNPEITTQLVQAEQCIVMFYEEFHLHHDPAGYPQVILRAATQQELFAAASLDDPLAYVTRF
jgi:hypothetical protein